MKRVKASKLHKPFSQLMKGFKHNILDELSEIFEQHGSAVHVEALAGLASFVYISDPHVNRELFVRNAAALEKAPTQTNVFTYVCGINVATATQDQWPPLRKEANKLFSRQLVEQNCIPQVEVTRNFMASHNLGICEANAFAKQIAAQAASQMILGRSLKSEELNALLDFSSAFSKRFNIEAFHIFPRPHWMMAPWRRELTKCKNDLSIFVRDQIEEFRESESFDPSIGYACVSIMPDNEKLLEFLITLLGGALDNIASATAWTVAYIAHDEDLQQQIRDEISRVGNSTEELNNCELLESTLMEVLRMRPPAISNQLRILKYDVEIDGYTLPKGTQILNSYYHMHHDESVFEHAETFNPRRFFDEKIRQSPSYAPFGHGPRNCVASGMAKQQLMAITTGILREYKLNACSNQFPKITITPFITPSNFEIQIEKI